VEWQVIAVSLAGYELQAWFMQDLDWKLYRVIVLLMPRHEPNLKSENAQ
jgi:hypothetical protein